MSSLKDFLKTNATFGGILFSVIASIIAMFIVFGSKTQFKAGRMELHTLELATKTKDDSEKISDQIKVLEERIKALSQIPKDIPIASKISEIEVQIAQLQNDMEGINSVILESPQKALQVPILKRDLESLKNQYLVSLKSLEREVARTYDLMKWVIGTIVLSILGLATSVFIRERKK